MSARKSFARKKFLAKKIQQNRRIPIFVMARTARRLTRNVKTRNWARQKLKVKIK